MIRCQSRITVAVFVAAALTATRAVAQITPPPAQDDQSRPRIHVGGLTANPTIALTNIGTDSNVFNSVDNPQSDFTATVSPGLDVWAHLGKARVSARGRSDLVYFKTFSSERSVDGGFGARVDIPFVRITPWFEGGSYSGRQRAGYEIDLRSRRTTDDLRAGVDVRVAPKTTVVLSGQHETTAWNGDALFLGNSLQQNLDRLSNTATISYQQHLTVLTTLVVEGSRVSDRFRYSPFRNTDSTRVVAGFDLKTRALIDGTARVGFRRFDAVGGGFDSYDGVVASADLGYVFHGTTRFAVEMARDANYSFETDYPYYLQTGATATITQRIVGAWDAQVRAGRQNLAYRLLAGASSAVPGRVDRVDDIGWGVGYRMHGGMRVGINMDRVRRQSPLQIRDFNGMKAGASISYAR